MFSIQNIQKPVPDLATGSSNKSAAQSANFTDILSEKASATTTMDSIFQKASKKYNVPVNLLKAVAKAESNFNPKALSRSGAAGVMQLMPKTAQSLGVKDSFDAEQNIMGGARYLRGKLDQYNDNTALALAAYNAGSGNVAKYGGIPPFKETKNYIEKVMRYAKENLNTSGLTVKKNPSNDSNQPNKAVEDIYHFETFSNQDYLLFIELLKSQMNSSLYNDYSNESAMDRIQKLY